jgi:hypothetical protein
LYYTRATEPGQWKLPHYFVGLESSLKSQALHLEITDEKKIASRIQLSQKD